MLSSALKLLVDFAEGTLETPWIDREKGSRVPHFAHSLGKWHHKVTVVAHYVKRIDLVFVRWMFLIANFAQVSSLGSIKHLRVVRDTCKEVSDIR